MMMVRRLPRESAAWLLRFGRPTSGPRRHFATMSLPRFAGSKTVDEQVGGGLRLNPKIPRTAPARACPDKPAGCGDHPQHRVDDDTVRLLERLSLVDFSDARGVRRLEEGIEFADPILRVNTDGVEPMFTVLEDATLRLRPDEECQQDATREEILSNAIKVEEDFFVAPPGNIPLDVKDKTYR